MSIFEKERHTDERPETNFSVYIAEADLVGKVLDAMSYIGDGEVTVKIVNDDLGNTGYCITGWADRKSDIDDLMALCVKKGINVSFGA